MSILVSVAQLQLHTLHLHPAQLLHLPLLLLLLPGGLLRRRLGQGDLLLNPLILVLGGLVKHRLVHDVYCLTRPRLFVLTLGIMASSNIA